MTDHKNPDIWEKLSERTPYYKVPKQIIKKVKSDFKPFKIPIKLPLTKKAVISKGTITIHTNWKPENDHTRTNQ